MYDHKTSEMGRMMGRMTVWTAEVYTTETRKCGVSKCG